MIVSRKIKMRRTLAFIIVALTPLIMAACGSDGESSNLRAGSTPIGTSAPRTTYPLPPTKTAAELSNSSYGWTLLDNSHTKLANYAGQVVVLDFYATWCPPCREETPHLVKLQKQYGARGLRVVGLNVGGAEDKDKVPGFVREFGISYALGYPDQAMVDLYLSDDDRIPQTYVFDQRGRLVKRFVSYDMDVPAELERVVQAALAGESNQAATLNDSGNVKTLTAVSH